jgi:hypothetical protein
VRRWLPSAILVVVGVLLVADLLLVNPSLAALGAALTELIVLLAAAAALAGAAALVVRHGTELLRGHDRTGAVTLGIGMAAMLVAGFYPGSAGSADPAVGWLVAALLGPLIAALFALVFVFLLGAARRAVDLRARETTLMLAAAGGVLVLLLPLGGTVGSFLATLAGWALTVPIGGVFRGLLIGVAIAVAIQATKLMLTVERADA